MGKFYGGYRGGCHGASRAYGQHRAAAGSYRSARSYSHSNKTAATWGARGAAAAYGTTGTKAAAASGAYRTTLAHGGTKGQAKAAARGAVAGLSGKGTGCYSRGSASMYAYSRAISEYSRAADSVQRRFIDQASTQSDDRQLFEYENSLIPEETPVESERVGKLSSKLKECISNLDELRSIIPRLHGCQLYRARIVETKLLNLIDGLNDLLCETGNDHAQDLLGGIDSADGIDYHAIEPTGINDCNNQATINDNDGPTIEYHELGA